ncbi:MAG: hypothetical protein C4336_02675 [Armatimonadota bacterium]
MRIGVLDIGSNSVLLLIAEQTAEGWRVLTDQTTITRLAEGFSPSHHLQAEAVARTLRTIQSYLQVCSEARVCRCVAIATAVVREAHNPEAILQPLHALAPDLTVWVLSESEEAELSFLSVSSDPLFRSEGRLAVIDVGGGSVEVCTGMRTPEWSHSFAIGAVRMHEQFGDNLFALQAHLEPLLTLLASCPPAERAVAIGGTGVNLALLAGKHSQFDPAIVHGTCLTLETLREIRTLMLALPERDRRQLPGAEPERARILPIGAFLLEQVLTQLRHDRCFVSIRGARYGVLEQLDRFIG